MLWPEALAGPSPMPEELVPPVESELVLITPPLMVTPPRNVLPPVRVCVPVPTLIRLPLPPAAPPEIAPL